MKHLCTILLFCCFGVTLAAPPESFEQAKKQAREVYKDHQTTFYCGCSYTQNGKKGTPILESCGYESPKNSSIAKEIWWEHVVPSSKLGDESNSDIKLRRSNLHNLVPAIGEVNNGRSNYPFTNFSEGSDCKKEARNYGACEIKISSECDSVEPPTHTRGAIARIYLYMWEKYQFRLDKEQKDMFNDWNETYPVTEWECERDRLIARAQYQGEHNSKVKEKCTEAGL